MPLGVVRQLDISSSFPPAPVGHLKLHPFAIFSAPFDTAATCLPSVKLQIQAHSPRYSPHHRKDRIHPRQTPLHPLDSRRILDETSP